MKKELKMMWAMLFAAMTMGCVAVGCKRTNEVKVDEVELEADVVEEKVEVGDEKEVRMNVYDMVEAFAIVESGKNPDAKNGNCVGYLQISPVCVKEANRILGDECFTLKDRYDMWASIAMFVVIMDAKNPEYDLKKACEIWNPTAGEWYYKRVLNAYKKLRDED